MCLLYWSQSVFQYREGTNDICHYRVYTDLLFSYSLKETANTTLTCVQNYKLDQQLIISA